MLKTIILARGFLFFFFAFLCLCFCFFNGEDYLEHQLNVKFLGPPPGDSDLVGLGWGGRDFYEPGRVLLSTVWEAYSGNYRMHADVR